MTPDLPIDERLCRCAVCGCKVIRHWFRTDFGAIGRCASCGQVLRADQPQRDAHVRLHQSLNPLDFPYEIHSEAAFHELTFYRAFLDLCAGQAGRKLLDIGTGTGSFLRLAASRGFEVAGIEPIAQNREIVERSLKGVRIESRPIEEAEFDPASIDHISMWDVIEHLVDPRGTLVRIHSLLKPGGYLGVATLNHASLMYVIFHIWRWTVPPLARQFAGKLYNPYHTYYFSKRSLARLIEQVGFEILEHHGYEFPISRLDVSSTIKTGMRALYVLQGLSQMEGEQYVFARKCA